MSISFPQMKSSYFPLVGGMDLSTPAISLPPGRAFDAQNYEPALEGGYRRIDGYERFDGRPSPTASASYKLLPVVMTENVAIGSGVNGVVSGVGGALLKQLPGYLVLGKIIGGTYNEAENLQVLGQTVGRTVGASTTASSISDDADYTLLAADVWRDDIDPVPGSGPIRGISVLNDVVYAFRDNEAGTAGKIWKATSSGWTEVAMGFELEYHSANTIMPINATVNNGLGASAVVKYYSIRTGSTSQGDAVGTLYFDSITGTFNPGDPIRIGAVQCATVGAQSKAVTRLPGGRVETVNYNFYGLTGTNWMYGCDGVNPAFEFDGIRYYPIHTGNFGDTPAHIAAFKKHLFLATGNSVQVSGIEDPQSWTAITGAAEINTGEPVTAMLPAGGDATASALSIFTRQSVQTLYGNSSADFQLQTTSRSAGFAPHTVQIIGNGIFGVTARGIQALSATQSYGDFSYSTVSQLVEPLMARKRGLECASTVMYSKSQYRLFFSDGSGIVVGLAGDKITGIMPINYGRVVRCMYTSTWTTGKERTFFGSDDGYVYEDNIGTSFDGEPIESWVRLAFNHEKSPRMRKRWRRAVLEVTAGTYCQVNFTYDLGYGHPDVSASPAVVDTPLIGSPGGYWDAFTWDQFAWDTQAVLAPSISIEGTEKNISLIFYSNRAQDGAHVLQGVTLLYSERRTER